MPDPKRTKKIPKPLVDATVEQMFGTVNTIGKVDEDGAKYMCLELARRGILALFYNSTDCAVTEKEVRAFVDDIVAEGHKLPVKIKMRQEKGKLYLLPGSEARKN